MSRDWPDRKGQETVFQVEAGGWTKTPKSSPGRRACGEPGPGGAG